MSEIAWLRQISIHASNVEVVEIYNGLLERLRDIDPNDLSVDELEDPREGYKVLEWRLGVLHAEVKSRAGVEQRQLLYWVESLDVHHLIEAKYDGFIPEFWHCDCCWIELLINTGDYSSEQTAIYPLLCQRCEQAGHRQLPDECPWDSHFGTER